MIHLDDRNIDSTLGIGITVVDFYADWCSPCKMIAPIFEKTASSFQGRVKFAKVDVESSPAATVDYKINSLPTIMVFKDGKVVEKHIGIISQKQLETLVNKQLEVTV